jgi:hypothetical protein
MDFLKSIIIDIYYYLIESWIGSFFQEHWGTISICLVIFGFIRILFPKKSDPTMTKKKYKKKVPHKSLTHTKIYE